MLVGAICFLGAVAFTVYTYLDPAKGGKLNVGAAAVAVLGLVWFVRGLRQNLAADRAGT
jgi:hypothetical protein